MRVIGFAGKKLVGKGEAASVLQARGYVHFNFADPLKAAVMDLFGFTREELYNPRLKEKVVDRWPHKSPREILQKFGTEVARNCAGGVWVRKWLHEIHKHNFVVCSDVRFPDEAEAVRSVGGRVILIYGREDALSDAAYAAHASEDDLPPELIDDSIINNGSIAQLHESVLRVVGI